MPHTVEEAYEVADAALAGDDAKLLDELGDLLYQSYFLALLLERGSENHREAVARSVTGKLIARHPHVFGDVQETTAERVRENWERLKVEQEDRQGVFHDVPETLPALLLARKVQRRAASAGFDYPDVAGALADLDEELRELRAELPPSAIAGDEPDRRVASELGDVLFACVNVARRLDVDPERELRAAIRRARVVEAERLAADDGADWSQLDLAGQDRYFDLAKNSA